MWQRMAPASILEGAVMCSPVSSAQIQADAVRLLEQSTFGPTDALVARVQTVGVQAFFNEQFAASASQYPAIKYVPAGQQATFCPTDPDPQRGRDYYTLFPVQPALSALAGDSNAMLHKLNTSLMHGTMPALEAAALTWRRPAG
jgi:hypothetical protein